MEELHDADGPGPSLRRQTLFERARTGARSSIGTWLARALDMHSRTRRRLDDDEPRPPSSGRL